MLDIKNLSVSTGSTPLIHALTLSMKEGEITALMGPNGSGKSTLAHVLAGHPAYTVTGGTVFFGKTDLLALKPEERAQKGVLLAFQYPQSIPGVSVSQFLRVALNAQEKAQGKAITTVAPFIRLLRVHMKELDIPLEFAERAVNDGFSGGEKKRLEILQALVLQPTLLILDEIDSGLDIDAIKTVAKAVNSLHTKQVSILIITHYQRLLNYIKPDSVHVMKNGSITESGDASLVDRLEIEGYTEQ